MKRARRLSKTGVLTGRQCAKALYLRTFRPELATPDSPARLAIFAQGTEVGIEARRRFPGGVLIETLDTDRALDLTAAAIRAGALTLFEGAFAHAGVLVRVDVLSREAPGRPWRLFEVKSGTQVREEHVWDVAVQHWVLTGAGLDVRRPSLMYINRECVFPRLEDLFAVEDLTRSVETIADRVPRLARELQAVLGRPDAPDVDIGAHCADPYECAFQAHCRRERNIPPVSVLNIPRLGERKWELYRMGIVDIGDPRIGDLNEAQRRMVEASRDGRCRVEREALAAALARLEHPVHHLDFESVAPAVPRYPGTRPYQPVPFQFSCHVRERPGGPVAHAGYLHRDASDPRPSFIAALRRSIRDRGSVVVYNEAFEKGCLADLAAFSPSDDPWLQGAADRIVDLLPVIRSGVYHPEFRGSFSIKAVAPALLGLSYDRMDIGGGDEAQFAFQRMLAASTDAAEADRIARALLAYCGQDTLALVRLVEWLERAAAQ